MTSLHISICILILCVDGIPIPYDPEWEVDRNCLQLYETLGEGAFGKVVKAYSAGLERCENSDSFVAIKMLKGE